MMRYDRRVNKKYINFSPIDLHKLEDFLYTKLNFLRLHWAHAKFNITSTNFRCDRRYGSLLRIRKKRIYTNCYYCLQLIIWLGEETQFFTRRTRRLALNKYMIYENTLQLMMCVRNEETKEIRIFSSSALNISYANVNQLDAKKALHSQLDTPLSICLRKPNKFALFVQCIRLCENNVNP